MQIKLLRVLQEGTFERVGDERPTRVNVRLISATNRDLKREVDAHRFREDLYYRLSVVPLAVPPLRKRLADLPLLAEHIIAEEARRADRRRDPSRPPLKVTLAREAIALLLAHPWPGNVRELQNVLRYAMIKCKGGVIRPEHLPPSLAVWPPGRKPKLTAEAVAHAIERAAGHPGEAARNLGVSRATMYRYLAKRK
jgi:DNA-binding NtrC family response regulator